MYHVIGTGIAVSVLYLISYIFYRVGIYTLANHRKIWNSVLAATFLITAIAGLFLALQINYKWDIPVIKSILKWHVETGAGLAITGIIHLLWHISYFTKIFRITDELQKKEIPVKLSTSSMGINLFIIGFTSMSVQILLLRELMNISGGYELNSGTFLASWLITSAIGASIAGRSSLNNIRRINLVFSLSPLISVILLVLLSRLFLHPGETPSFLVSLIFTFMVLVPFCLISGFAFIKLISAATLVNGFTPGRSFSIETTGGIAAGMLLTILTAGILNTYKLLLVIILMSVAYTLLTHYIENRSYKIIIKITFAILASSIIIGNPDVFFKKMLLPGIKVNMTKDTPYGNIIFGKYGGERSIYYNHQLIAYSDDVAEREENIHYAMLQADNPENVMIVSGSLKSLMPELIKYPLKKIVFVERDPELLKIETEQVNSRNIELKVVNKDGFRYIKGDTGQYDVILLLVPPPSTLSLNRYYTTEFFTEVKNNLGCNGIFMCSPGIWDNYPNKESITLFSSIYNSLDEVFNNVQPIVGNKLYLIASEIELSDSICKLTIKKGIENIYVGPDFLADDLIKLKSDEVESMLDKGVRNNRITFPISSYHSQTYFISKNLDEKIPALIIMIILFAMPLISIRRNTFMMYFSAASLAGYEIIALLSIQLVAGNMYQLTGSILAVFMTGLALGSGMKIRIMVNIPLKIKALSILIWYLIITLIINYIISIFHPFTAILIIIISILPPSILTGHIFRELTNADPDCRISAKTYSADLAGSALGFIIISGIVVPLLGIQVSIFILSGLIFAGIVLGTNRNL